MLDMKRELENMKWKNVEERDALKVENETMKRLELGHTPTAQEDLKNHRHSENKMLTQMEEEKVRTSITRHTQLLTEP